ncbi:MAG TPA: hypothetical protein VF345_15125 [Chthoniobacterales bacterium]
MNGDKPKIEIFEPFGAAFELMKKILFQPFDFAKWCVIGFAAFLSGSWGSGFRLRFPLNGNWNFRSTSYHNMPASESLPSWLLPFIIAIAIFVLIWIFVVMWIVSRGRFIFIDCVVKNRAAIVAPWREYRREGNSFFLFSLAVTFLAMVIMTALVLLIVVPLGLFAGGKGTAGLGTTAVFAFVFIGLVLLAFTIFFAVVSQFMVPVMYRRRCLAREAFFAVSKLVLARPGPFVLFVLFGIVLVMALVLTSTIVSCLTCCIAGLPYVSSVVLLPAFVWLLAFKLLFLRQFGPEYDVWAVADFSSLATPPAPSSVPPSPTD